MSDKEGNPGQLVGGSDTGGGWKRVERNKKGSKKKADKLAALFGDDFENGLSCIECDALSAPRINR